MGKGKGRGEGGGLAEAGLRVRPEEQLYRLGLPEAFQSSALRAPWTLG